MVRGRKFGDRTALRRFASWSGLQPAPSNGGSAACYPLPFHKHASAAGDLPVPRTPRPVGGSPRVHPFICFGRIVRERKFGGARGDRTPDLLNAIQARSQLRHSPTRRTTIDELWPLGQGSFRWPMDTRASKLANGRDGERPKENSLPPPRHSRTPTLRTFKPHR